MTATCIKKMKLQIVLASKSAGEGHIPSAFSILDLLWVLYDQVMKFDANRPNELAMDRFVLSKGHASLALYAVLAEKGFFSPENLDTFCKYDIKLGGHPALTTPPATTTAVQ